MWSAGKASARCRRQRQGSRLIWRQAKCQSGCRASRQIGWQIRCQTTCQTRCQRQWHRQCPRRRPTPMLDTTALQHAQMTGTGLPTLTPAFLHETAASSPSNRPPQPPTWPHLTTKVRRRSTPLRLGLGSTNPWPPGATGHSLNPTGLFQATPTRTIDAARGLTGSLPDTAETRGHGSDGPRPQCLDVDQLMFDEAERDVRQNSLERPAELTMR